MAESALIFGGEAGTKLEDGQVLGIVDKIVDRIEDLEMLKSIDSSVHKSPDDNTINALSVIEESPPPVPRVADSEEVER